MFGFRVLPRNLSVVFLVFLLLLFIHVLFVGQAQAADPIFEIVSIPNAGRSVAARIADFVGDRRADLMVVAIQGMPPEAPRAARAPRPPRAPRAPRPPRAPSCPEPVRMIAIALGDESETVRVTAAQSLGRLEEACAVEVLVVALSDEVGMVRQMSAQALGRIEDTRAVEALVERLQDELAEVRLVSAQALGRIEDRAAVGGLLAPLMDEGVTGR